MPVYNGSLNIKAAIDSSLDQQGLDSNGSAPFKSQATQMPELSDAS